MSHFFSAALPASSSPNHILAWSGRAWFTVAAIGQLAFIGFIIAFYYTSTFAGDFAAWNTKPLVKGFQAGDTSGNLMFAAHVLMAGIMTPTGVIQLIPRIRSRAPALHRLSGRIFVVLACALALGGLWLGWFRDTRLSPISAYAIALDAVLILAFAVPTVAFALRRNFAKHQRWAMRLFLVASGVWFMRIAIMAWLILAGGPVGMNETMSGPTDVVIAFGCYLIPLAIYEVYWRAKSSGSNVVKAGATSLVLVSTVITALGVFGTVAFMWLPYL